MKTLQREETVSPCAGRGSRFVFFSAFLCIALLAAGLRSYDLVSRPLHNDEGVNFFFLQSIGEKGYYEYSHENYHGPAYFYWSYLWLRLFGENEAGVRAAAAITGVLTLLLLLPLRRTEGDAFVLTAALLLALSASHVYYSRYAIHENLFVCASLGVGISVYLWARVRERIYLYSGCLSLALLIATKETFVIALFCIGLAALLLGDRARALEDFHSSSRPLPKAAALLETALPYREWWARVKDLVRQWPHVFWGALFFFVALAALFSGGFQWSKGLDELLQGVPQWVGRNQSDTGHFKPFWYYAKSVIWLSEPWLALVLACPIFALATRLALRPGRAYQFAVFSTAWTLLSFVVYSVLNYKTAWLVINITTPAVLALAWWLAALWQGGMAANYAAIALLGAILGASAYTADLYNFKVAFGKSNPFSYVHTSQGMLDLAHDTAHYLRSHPRAKVLVGVASYWPLPFYYRAIASQLGYMETKDPAAYAAQYDILIIDSRTPWNPPASQWKKKYYRLSEVQEAYAYFFVGER